MSATIYIANPSKSNRAAMDAIIRQMRVMIDKRAAVSELARWRMRQVVDKMRRDRR